MRILQLIDSLETGGAEKMAVNYANALSRKAVFSGLIATRKEGSLKCQIDHKVAYLFLNRKKTIDFAAMLRLYKYCRKNKVNYIQAHSSSFFVAVLLKMILPKIKIIWHVHNGASEFLSAKELLPLKIVSPFFQGIIAVNGQLQKWTERKLHCGKSIYLPNFTNNTVIESKQTQLGGNSGKRILCLANLRFQKNHLFLLEVARRIKTVHPNWSFHLVGKDWEDEYSNVVKAAIITDLLQDNVSIYGAKNDVQHIISQSDIAVLTSQSEGLPIALLEYGLHKKPVVVTAVGEIPLIVNHGQNGFIVSKDDVDGFFRSVISLIENESLRQQFGIALEHTIRTTHSEQAVIDKMLDWLAQR